MMDAVLLELCAIGAQLRYRANFQAYRIRSDAWLREGVTPLARSNMLEAAREASAPGYSEAFAAWQEHYHDCPICQAALRPGIQEEK